MKPSPPNKPEPNFFLKCIESSTPRDEAKNADFCKIMALPGVISNALIEPGKHEATAISPGPPWAV